jgi:uncharacterized protein
MADTPTRPGVYIEEVPSGARTIMGLATSITAFIGRAHRGPVDEPVTLTGFGDFERTFGGLRIGDPMSYAVRDFFVNGGVQAVVVRLYNPPGGNATAQIDAGDLILDAASEGTWGNALRARIDHDVPTPAAPTDPHPLPWVDAFGLTSDDLFNLTVRDTASGATETFPHLTVAESPRRVDRVLEGASVLARASGALPGSIPAAHDDPDHGDAIDWDDDDQSSPVATAGSDSTQLDQAAYEGSRANKTGLFALEKTDLFNLLCIPPDTRSVGDAPDVPAPVWATALAYCVERRAMLIVDPPAGWNDVPAVLDPASGLGSLNLAGPAARNAALYFPRVRLADPLREGQAVTFAPCGVVAGVIARTDATHGVWKAPAGRDAALNGTQGLSVEMTDRENGRLNPLGVNCLRSFPVIGRVVWGARTLRGADQLADEYKYLPVRRLALFIEESLLRGTRWVVFEPNGEPLWSQIRLNVGAFMQTLFRQGAFRGSFPREAYFVKVDGETTTRNDRNPGIANIVVGFAPLKPAEFVIIKIQQSTGQSDP